MPWRRLTKRSKLMTISSRDLKYVARALEASTASDVPRTKLGAVIVNGKRTMAEACNISKTHPLQAHYNQAVGNDRPRHQLHAEVHAILRAGFDNVKGATIYVARYDRRGRLAEAAPCRACSRALRDAGISRVVYTTAGGIKSYARGVER